MARYSPETPCNDFARSSSHATRTSDTADPGWPLSEIEKLERRYAENPQGLTFAPLAEVHRKNGDVARALELLRPGLTLHPDYIPASIVLGRCHLDLGDLPAAEAAFTHVLELDGENVIALKALADITERLLAVRRGGALAPDPAGGRPEQRRGPGPAGGWKPPCRQSEVGLVGVAGRRSGAQGLVDPRSRRRRGQRWRANAVTAEADYSHEREVTTIQPAPGPRPLASERPSVRSRSCPSDPMLWPWVEGSESATAASRPPSARAGGAHPRRPPTARLPPDGMEIEQPVTLEEPVEPLSGLVGRDDRSHGADLHVTPDEWQVETAEDIVLESAGGSEFQVANAAEELLSAPLLREPEPLFSPRPAVEREEVTAESQPVGSTDAASAEPAQADAGTKEEAPADAWGLGCRELGAAGGRTAAALGARPHGDGIHGGAAPAARAHDGSAHRISTPGRAHRRRAFPGEGGGARAHEGPRGIDIRARARGGERARAGCGGGADPVLFGPADPRAVGAGVSPWRAGRAAARPADGPRRTCGGAACRVGRVRQWRADPARARQPVAELGVRGGVHADAAGRPRDRTRQRPGPGGRIL